MGDRIAAKAWRITHTYDRRPRSTFTTTIAAVLALHFSLLAARRAGGTHPPGPGSGRMGPAVSAQHGDLVTLAMADEPKPRRRRWKMLVLLGVGVAAWLVRYRIRKSHGLDNTWQHLPAAPPPARAATPRQLQRTPPSRPPPQRRTRSRRSPLSRPLDRAGHSDAADPGSGAARRTCTGSRDRAGAHGDAGPPGQARGRRTRAAPA